MFPGDRADVVAVCIDNAAHRIDGFDPRDDASASCSGSSQLDPLSASSACTVQFTTPSTFNATSSPDPHCGSSGRSPAQWQDAVAPASCADFPLSLSWPCCRSMCLPNKPVQTPLVRAPAGSLVRPISLRVSQALLNPGYAGMPTKVSQVDWILPPTCKTTIQRAQRN